MKNIKLIIEYDGTEYHGWQEQINAKSVQKVIKDALNKITGEKIILHGAGRTDAGVHAFAQAANFLTNCNIPADRFKYALNGMLPDDIVVKLSEEVDLSFHARKSALSKEYVYKIMTGDSPSAIMARYAYYYPYKMDLDKIIKTSSYLIGKHDFASFKASGSSVKTSVRTIKSIKIKNDDGMIRFDIEADGFLYNMVRIIIGTLLMIDRKGYNKDYIEHILKSKDRSLAGPTVPAKGLYLYKVYY